jgi:hypothetical protein
VLVGQILASAAQEAVSRFALWIFSHLLSISRTGSETRPRNARPSQPLCDTTVVRTRSAPAPAETVRAISTLCSRSRRRAGTVFRPFHRLPSAVHIATIVGALWFRVVRGGLINLGRSRATLWRLRLRGEKLKSQKSCEQHDRKASLHFPSPVRTVFAFNRVLR